MQKIPKDDPRAQKMSSDVVVDRAGLDAFITGKRQWILSTTRGDGRPQLSMVTGGLSADGHLLVSTYPSRVKAKNARRDPLVSVLVMGDQFNAEWVQIDGTASVGDVPDAVEDFVEYFRCISGEHPDWDDYRKAMIDQGKSIIKITPTRWGPVSKGGFPPSLFE
jgi:PPOX class probable F420-dependent enzyme